MPTEVRQDGPVTPGLLSLPPQACSAHTGEPFRPLDPGADYDTYAPEAGA
jgi:hypothetical protein